MRPTSEGMVVTLTSRSLQTLTRRMIPIDGVAEDAEPEDEGGEETTMRAAL